jgi:hypothetical protein
MAVPTFLLCLLLQLAVAHTEGFLSHQCFNPTNSRPDKHASPTFLLCLLLQLAVSLIDGCLSGIHQLNCTAPRSKGARLQRG